MSMDSFRVLIRDVPDFPEPGITYRDITPLLADAAAFRAALDAIAKPFVGQQVTTVVGIEARGFIFGAPIATRLNAGFIPVRKSGKLPWQVATQSYTLEYGTGELEMHRDALASSDSVLIVDDVLATGGTARAAVELVEQFGANVVGVAVLIELDPLKGRGNLAGVEVHSVVHYDGS